MTLSARSARWAPWLVAGATVAVFAPILDNGWVQWDDPMFLLKNERYRVLSPENLSWMLTQMHGGTYQPLGWLSYALDFKLWGLSPRGFHLTSLLLHALNAALVYALTLRLLRPCFGDRAREADRVTAAALGALLFALHPLRVESVAWASERREAIAAALYLSAILAYLKADGEDPGAGRWRAASLGLIVLSIMAKALAITAPIVLLALDWLRGARRPWREKVPFALASAAAAAIGYLAQIRAETVWTWHDYGLGKRLAQMSYGLCFYLAKTLWPLHLSPFYELPRRFSPLEPRYLACGAAVALVTALAWRQRLRRPGWLAAWLCYAALLAPVIGLSQSGRQFAADRYSYLACLGFSTLAAAGWLAAASLDRPRLRVLASAGAGAVLLTLAYGTRRQLPVWHDSVSLWSRAAEIQPDSPIARNNLGFALITEGRLDEAMTQFQASLDVNEDCPKGRTPQDQACLQALLHLSTARAQKGDLKAAIDGFHLVLGAEPGNVDARRNLEHALALTKAR